MTLLIGNQVNLSCCGGNNERVVTTLKGKKWRERERVCCCSRKLCGWLGWFFQPCSIENLYFSFFFAKWARKRATFKGWGGKRFWQSFRHHQCLITGHISRKSSGYIECWKLLPFLDCKKNGSGKMIIKWSESDLVQSEVSLHFKIALFSWNGIDFKPEGKIQNKNSRSNLKAAPE